MARRVRLNASTINRWVRDGWLTPAAPDYSRTEDHHWSDQDLALLHRVKGYLDSGFPPPVAIAAARADQPR